MPRARPVHNLTQRESALAQAIADERAGPSEPAFNRRIADRITAYWAARGFDVVVSVERAGFSLKMRGSRFDVRSDMRNGWPRGATP